VRCDDAVNARLTQLYNQARGTHYDDYQALSDAILARTVEEAQDPGAGDEGVNAQSELGADGFQFDVERTRAEIALRCQTTDQHFETVLRPEQAEISIELGSDSQYPSIY